MHWISELIKDVIQSRLLNIALFITSTILVFGQKYFPTIVPTVPSNWKWAVMAVFIFTAFLIVVWLLEAIYSWLKNTLPLRATTQEEKNFLYILAPYADKALNLEELHDANKGNVSKLKLLELSKSLRKKGYIEKNPYSENLVYLTEKGRTYALKAL